MQEKNISANEESTENGKRTSFPFQKFDKMVPVVGTSLWRRPVARLRLHASGSQNKGRSASSD